MTTTRVTTDRFEATPRYYAPREAVWDVLCSPATSARAHPEFLHTAVLPGTGPGVGEVRVHVIDGAEGLRLAGSIVREMRTLDWVRWAATDSGGTPLPSETTAAFTDGPAFTTVHWTTTLRWPRGVPINLIETGAATLQQHLDTFLSGAGQILGVPMDLDGVWRVT